MPSGVLFLVGTALGGNRNRLLATALWLAAAALTVAVLRVERSEGAGWFGGTRRRAVATTVRVGAGLAAAAVIIGVIAGPALPGASSDPLVDTRQGRSSRTTLSPLVDIQARLVNQSDEELFTVSSPRPAYWRLTALDDYDLRIWRSSRSYGDASGTLSGGLRDNLSTPLDHIIHITGLDSVWLPAAFAPRSVSIPDQVRYDAESGSLLIRRSSLPTGLTYELTSVVPNVDAATVEATAANGTLPPVIADHYLDLPVQLPGPVPPAGHADHGERHDALRQGARAPELVPDELHLRPQRRPGPRRDRHRHVPLAAARLLRAVRRDLRRVRPLDRPPVAGGGRLHAGRSRRRRASTTCAVATPTPGPRSTSSGVGWLAFEPTPGRGEPGAEGYTGVPAAQDGGDPADARLDRAVHGDHGGAPAPRPAARARETGDEQVLGRAEPRWRRQLRRRPEPGLDVLPHRPRPGRAGDHRAHRPRRRRRRARAAVAPSLAQRALPGRPGPRLVAAHGGRPAPHRARDRAQRDAATRSRCASGRLLDRSGSTGPTQELGELADQATAAAYSGHLDGGDPDRCEDLRDTLQHRAVARLPSPRASASCWSSRGCRPAGVARRRRLRPRSLTPRGASRSGGPTAGGRECGSGTALSGGPRLSGQHAACLKRSRRREPAPPSRWERRLAVTCSMPTLPMARDVALDHERGHQHDQEADAARAGR